MKTPNNFIVFAVRKSCVLALLIVAIYLSPLPGLWSAGAPSLGIGENGEIYVLISGGEAGGVHALNNLTAGSNGIGVPEILFNPTNKINTTIRGLKVDSARNIFFFKVEADPSFKLIPGNIRVRINSTSYTRGAHHTTHNWHGFNHMNHYGHYNPTSHKWSQKCGKPGWGDYAVYGNLTGASMPVGYIPSGYSATDKNKPNCTSNWYWAPNKVAYHSHVRSRTDGRYGRQVRIDKEDSSASTGSSYYIFAEKQFHKLTEYFLMEWLDVPVLRVQNYANQDILLGSGNRVANTEELNIERRHVNGCHDGCTGGNNTSSVSSTPWISEVVVSTKGGDVQSKDVYLYKRQIGEDNGIILRNDGKGSIKSDSIIGYAADKSTNYLAVSSRDDSNDWVYLLGDRIIKEWLSDFGMPTSGLSIDEVVVSDQWWQDGGIVFALDRKSKEVFKFRRDESNQDHGRPEKINVPANTDSIGSDGYGNLYYAIPRFDPPDTASFIPAYQQNGGHIKSISWSTYSDKPPLVVGVGMATFQQKVTKTVYRYGYVSREESEVAPIVIGYNTYTRTVMVDNMSPGENPDNLPAKWKWSGAYELQSKVDETVRTEITAVNYATPPQVTGFQPAHLDIDGPYFSDPIEGMIIPFEKVGWTGYEEGETYIFGVENRAIPDLNINDDRYADRAININSGEGDTADGLKNESLWHCLEMSVDNDENGQVNGALDNYNHKLGAGGNQLTDWKGGFPGTVDFTTLRYRWTLYQYENRYGMDVTKLDRNKDGKPDGPRAIYDQTGDASKSFGWKKFSYFPMRPSGGKYELRLEAKYHWFDYDKLPRGSLASARWSVPGVYVPPKTPGKDNSERGKSSDDGVMVRYQFYVKPGEQLPPQNPGKIVCRRISPLDGESPAPPDTPRLVGNRWIIDEDREVLWELTAKDASDKRIDIMLQDSPPFPAGIDPNRIQDLKWADPVNLEITITLQYPKEPANHPRAGEQAASFGPFIKLGKDDSVSNRNFSDRYEDLQFWSGRDDKGTEYSDESEFFSIPSDPVKYKLRMKAWRDYTYWIYWPMLGEWVEALPPAYEIEAETEVLVRDVEAPEVLDIIAAYADGNRISGTSTLYATTGGELVLGRDPSEIDPDQPPPLGNPVSVTVILQDNNPMDSYKGAVNGGYANQLKPWGDGRAEKTDWLDAINPGAAVTNNALVDEGRYSNLHSQQRFARLSYEAFAMVEVNDDPEIRPALASERHFLPAKNIVESNESGLDSRLSNSLITMDAEADGLLSQIAKPVKEVSYYQYTFDLSGVSPLSKHRKEGQEDLAYEWTDHFSFHYANNTRGWQSPGIYGNFSDSSGNVLEKVKLGEIMIRDNIQPNPFLLVEIIGRESNINFAPRGLPKSSFLREITRYDEDQARWVTQEEGWFSFFNNGDWFDDLGQVDKNVVPWQHFIDLGNLTNQFWTPSEPLFPVTPLAITFQPVPDKTRVSINGVFSSDNITDRDDITLTYTVRDSANGSDIKQVGDGKLPVQFIFYESDDSEAGPRNIIMSAYIEDDALDWNGQPLANRRNFRYFLPVYQTRVSRHILETRYTSSQAGTVTDTGDGDNSGDDDSSDDDSDDDDSSDDDGEDSDDDDSEDD